MAQADFSYARAADSVGLPISVSIFADDPQLRTLLQEDVAAAGLAVRECGNLGQLLAGEVRALGELVLVDCPQPGAADMAVLTRIDSRAARSGARLVISTSLDSIDIIFGCCAESGAQILINPLRAERVIALGRVLAETPNLRLRELSEDDRLTLLRLTEQVCHLSERLDRLDSARGWGQRAEGGAFRFESPSDPYRGDRPVVEPPPPALPDARLVRKIIADRQARAKFLDAELFADPAWEMLLDLTAARVEGKRVSVTSLCIASGVPATTALRWIGQMVEAGLFVRVEDDTDRRRAFIDLSDKAADAMARYFAEIGQNALAPA